MKTQGVSKTAKVLAGIGCLFVPILLFFMALLLFPSLRFLLITESMFDGFFPSGEYRLRITNESDEPVNGARLSIYKGNTQQLAFGYPIDNYGTEGDLISDESGWIVALHKPRGFEFGGTCRHFLLIPVSCDATPHFNFLLTANGYRTMRFSEDDFFYPNPAREAIGTTSITLDNGQEEEIPVYELLYEMKK